MRFVVRYYLLGKPILGYEVSETAYGVCTGYGIHEYASIHFEYAAVTPKTPFFPLLKIEYALFPWSCAGWL